MASQGVGADETDFKESEAEKLVESRVCFVGNKLKNDEELIEIAKSLSIPVVFSEDGKEFMDDGTNYDTAFVIENFEGSIYEGLRQADLRIWGPPILRQYSRKKERLPFNLRPLYCTAMRSLIICFTGFRSKEELTKLANLIHHMGGSIRKDFSVKVTHLVATCSGGEKYRYAVTFGIPIMSEDWIYSTWERRNDIDCHATDESLMKHRVQPFFACCVAFSGFTEDEQKHMEELTIQNGGTVVNMDDATCTQVVVEDRSKIDVTETIACRSFVVKAEWFWTSIQMDACADETMYLYNPQSQVPSKTATLTPVTPCSRMRKRKRLKETLGQLAQIPEPESSHGKRRSSDLFGVSLSKSFFDTTVSPERLSPVEDTSANDSILELPTPSIKSPIDIKSMSARQQVCRELLQTENNYVGILETVLHVFKQPLESLDQVGGPLLDPTELKIIFGNLPPIYEVHCKILKDLSELFVNWKESCSIGNVFLTHSKDLMKAYPPFVNFFEQMKEKLAQCDRSKPRFHAFMKIAENKKECGRQSLVELLIRPVQRLPSIILLLNDIMKRTGKNNPDMEALDNAVKAVKEVLTHINEDKRKTENQVAMFDIVNDIENCPANLLSSHRSFVTKTDVMELGESVSSRKDNLTLFLFTDMLEICKRRNRMGSMKSPSNVSLISARSQKTYKHLELMSLNHIKRVVDIVETEECKNVFALVYRSNEETKESLYTFKFQSPDADKIQFLQMLCRHIANTCYRADSENFLISLEPHELEIEPGDENNSTLSRAMSRFASKTKKVGRAFSFNKTPRKLKRAMSSMISPFQPSPMLNSITSMSSTLRGSNLSLRLPNSGSVDFQESSSLYTAQGKIKSNSFGASSSKLL